jgi:hypothetical protein
MNALLAALPCLAQDGLPFPAYDKPPWAGFAAGTTATRTDRSGQILTEEKVEIVKVDKDGVTVRISKTGEGEGLFPFTAFTAALAAEGTGCKVIGKSHRPVQIGPRRVRALVREFAPPDSIGTGAIRITTADELPAGIVEMTFEAEDGRKRTAFSYAFKGIEKVKAGDREVEAARFELLVTEGKARKTEGTCWLSSQVPGLLVRSRLKATVGREVAETFLEATKFEVKKQASPRAASTRSSAHSRPDR